MADSIKGRTEKGRRKSALNKLTKTLRFEDGRKAKVSPNNIVEGSQRGKDKRTSAAATKGQTARKAQTAGVSTARGPNAAIQSPKKPKAPKRGSFSLGLPKTRK